MVGKSPELIIKIIGDGKQFNATLDGIDNRAKKSLNAQKIAAGAAAAGFIALAAGAAASVQEFRRFEAGFTNVVTLLDEGSFKTKTFNQGVDDLKQGIIDLRATSGQSFDTLNKGLFDLVSAGVAAEDAIASLGIATNLAIAGATDTSVAVDGITSALNAYELSATETQAVAEKFFTAQKFGKTTVEELASGFGLVASTAANFGVSLDELLASVSAVTTGGVQTSQAYTGLAAILANISKPTEDAAKEAKLLGIEFNSTALRAKGLEGFLSEIVNSATFTDVSLEKLFGSVEAVRTVLALTGAGADDFEKILKGLGDETQRNETFNNALEAQLETLDQKYAQLEGSASRLATELGEKLSPAFANFADNAIIALDSITDSLDDVEDAVKALNFALEDALVTYTQFLANITGTDIDLARPVRELEQNFSEVDPFGAITASAMTMAEGVQAEFERIAEAERKANAESLRRTKEKEIAEEEAAARKAEKDAEARERQLELEEERFEEDLENLTERLTQIDELEAQFDGLRELRQLAELRKKAQNAQQIQQIDKQTAIAAQQASDAATQTSLDNLQTLFDEETAVGKAIFLIRKAQAIANVITSTQQAMALARATVPPPGGEALATRYAIAGAINVGVIAGTAIQEVTGAREGGIVQGGMFGRDTQPFLLARDEIIVPSRLNPLSPNFEETFGGAGIGGQNVNVQIGLNEEASRLITVQQREDRVLGVQR